MNKTLSLYDQIGPVLRLSGGHRWGWLQLPGMRVEACHECGAVFHPTAPPPPPCPSTRTMSLRVPE